MSLSLKEVGARPAQTLVRAAARLKLLDTNSQRHTSRHLGLGALVSALLCVSTLHAKPKTPGYPEQVVQWTVGEGETCGDIALALYGSSRHAALIERYSNIQCRGGSLVLKQGTTLVVPAEVTSLATAELRSVKPEVRTKPPGGGWEAAGPGAPLHQRYSVNTREDARADIRFLDRTRIFLSEKTLVVIYGTARQSQVARQREVVAELESGELQAGLAAISGRTTELGVAGGGRVSAASRDTVLRKNQAKKRTTVSVFDGEARVTSAGKAVDVAKGHGSAFVDSQAPSAARPLPPPPAWDAATSPLVVLASRVGAAAGVGVIRAAWLGIPDAVSYRVELATDSAFQDLVVREEVGADIKSFRAEKMPVGRYYLRVRAIDDEDFLGIASVQRSVNIVAVQGAGAGGLPGGSKLLVHRYRRIAFDVPAGVEVNVDGKGYGPAPKLIDFGLTTPKHLSFRGVGEQAQQTFDVEYVVPRAEAQIERMPDGRFQISTTFPGIDPESVSARMQPRLRVLAATQQGAALSSLPAPVDLAASAGSSAAPGGGAPSAITAVYTAVLPALQADHLDVVVVDAQGRLLGDARWDAGVTPGSHRLKLADPRIGASLALNALHPASSTRMWAPHRRASAGLTASLSPRHSAQLTARVQGSTGRGRLPEIGFDALVPSDDLSGEGRPVDTAAWLGTSAELWQPYAGWGSMGIAARIGLPTREGAAGVGEVSAAYGRQHLKLDWLFNLGVRAALGDAPAGGDGSGFIAAQLGFQALDWARAYAALDVRLIVGDESVVPDGLAPRGGLALGLEAGGDLFANLAARVSAWDELDDQLLVQLGAGYRGF